MLFKRLAGVIPLGIGICFMGTWLSFTSGEHSIPIFFKLFGVFISLPFIGIGLAAIFGKIPSVSEQAAALQKQVDEGRTIPPPGPGEPLAPGKLKCPNCGSSPGAAEVSPHGDVKCDHCSRWYNVHTA